jgi:hypothetical protein
MLPTLLNNKDYEVAPYVTLSEIYDINLKYLDTIQNQWPQSCKVYVREETD